MSTNIHAPCNANQTVNSSYTSCASFLSARNHDELVSGDDEGYLLRHVPHVNACRVMSYQAHCMSQHVMHCHVIARHIMPSHNHTSVDPKYILCNNHNRKEQRQTSRGQSPRSLDTSPACHEAPQNTGEHWGTLGNSGEHKGQRSQGPPGDCKQLGRTLPGATEASWDHDWS